MPTMQSYQCPCCGGAITFDSASQNMKCPYCDSEFEPEALEQYREAMTTPEPECMQWQTSESQFEESEQQTLCAYRCQSCGGELITDANTAATHCPYCGNPVVLGERLDGALKPDYVIPFKLDKQAAMNALLAHYKGKKLLPKVFRDENYIKEIKGIYVPFWLFDADVSADLRYRATRVRFWSDSRYNYTETRHYLVSRAGSLSFAKVPVDGSSKMPDDLMESLEPYDFSQAVDFHTAYLAGFLADKYDVDAKQSMERANDRIRRSTQDTFAATVIGYSSVIPEHTALQVKNGTAKYALFPVWLLTTKWNDQLYTFAMNGQTGKFAGDLPMDKKAFFRWLFGMTAVATPIILILGRVLGFL